LLDSDQICLSSALQQLVPYLCMETYKGAKKFGYVQAPQTYLIGKIDDWDRASTEFHNVSQGYRAFHDAVMLTGSNALIGTEALQAVEYFYENSVTEDIFTGAKIQAAGFQTFFHPEAVAFGLVPERVPDILRQRLRWAQGSFQFLKSFNKVARRLSLRQKLTYLSGICHFLLTLPILLISFFPPLILIWGFDMSLHYSNLALLCLAAFIFCRYFARQKYYRRNVVEKTAACYLPILYAPVYTYALLSAFTFKSLAFWATPKTLTVGHRLKFNEIVYYAFPLLIAVLNMYAVIVIVLRGIRGSYPLTYFFTDYGGTILLAIYFVLCGVSIMTITSRSKNIAN